MKLNFTWKKQTGQDENGESLFLNRVYVGGYQYNNMRSRENKDESITYAGNIALSLRENRVYGATPEEIKTKIENIVTQWFEEALK